MLKRNYFRESLFKSDMPPIKTATCDSATNGDRHVVAFRSRGSRFAAVNSLVVLGVCLAALCSGTLAFLFATTSSNQNEEGSSSTPQVSDSSDFAIEIRRPTGPPTVDVGQLDFHGKPVSIACAACHATRRPNLANKLPSDLNEFHTSLELVHGNIACMSCHNQNDYDSLKLADGSRVEFQNVMTLCAQCHGQQAREFDLGIHGGMTGYWDLSRGGQQKNNCVDCHHPHKPAFPKMKPTFKPKDRFLDNSEHHDEH